MSNRKGHGRIVNRSELAEFFGVAMPTIDHWLRTGCPFVARGGRGVSWSFNTAAVATWREQRARDETAGTVLADAGELNRRRLAAQTALAELELAKAKAEVAPVWQFERAMRMAFAEVQSSMRTIPARVATIIVGETDAARIKAVLAGEIDQALEAMADAALLDDADLDDADDDGES